MSDQVFTREIDDTQRRLDDLQEEIGSTENLKDAEHALAHAASELFGNSGLRALYTMTTFNSAGDLTDLGGRDHHMTLNGNPQFGRDTLIPYVALDGTGDFFSVADTADFDITGTETVVQSASNGLTMLHWIYFDNAPGSFEVIASKWNSTGNQKAYEIFRSTGGAIRFRISTDGSADYDAVSVSAPATATWAFVAGRFIPSTQTDVWVNDEQSTNSVATPASIFNGSGAYQIGANSGISLLTGRESFGALYAMALTTNQINAFFQQTRDIFGV